MNYVTVPLESNHKKKDFKCGKASLDNYLHMQAKQDVKKRLSACFVLEDDENVIKGYYTLSNESIPRELMTEAYLKKMPPAYSRLPVTLLGRLAVDNRYQKQKLGEILLFDALERSCDNSGIIGSMAVVVDPLDEDARKFYEKYDFISLPGTGRMFLPMDKIILLFK